MSRGDFFAGLYILGCANGLAGGIIQSARSGDWVGGFANISVIVLFACFAGVTLLLRDNRTELIRAPDFAVAAVFLLLVALPVSPASWLAVTGLSFYILLLGHGGSARGRGAVILLAVTVPMLWSPILFHFFSEPILATDAAMVSWLLGTERVGNMVRMARWLRKHGGVSRLLIAQKCVGRIPLLDRHQPVRRTHPVAQGFAVLSCRLRVGDRGECCAHLLDGVRSGVLSRDPQSAGRHSGEHHHAGSYHRVLRTGCQA